MRLFISLEFDENIKEALTDIQRQFREAGVRGNYSRTENFHLTLAFIGEYKDKYAVFDAMDRTDFRPFSIRLDRCGTFGKGDILWAGIEKNRELNEYAQRLREELKKSSIPFDGKKFSPHITLVRQSSFTGKESFPPVKIKKAEMKVKRISLMKSERSYSGVVYTELGYID